MKKLIATAFACATGLAATGALAQAFPSKPLKLVIPFAAGGGNDIVARVVAARLGQGFNQPMVVENRPGANGFIAPRAVADAPADGRPRRVCAVGGQRGPQERVRAARRRLVVEPVERGPAAGAVAAAAAAGAGSGCGQSG